MRLQVNVGEDVVKRIDSLAKEIGVSRSALCSMIIYRSLPNPNDDFENEMFDEWIKYRMQVEQVE